MGRFCDLEIELFVTDLEAGERLVERLSRIVPVAGPTQFGAPQMVETEQLDEELYRITATAQIALGLARPAAAASRRSGSRASARWDGAFAATPSAARIGES